MSKEIVIDPLFTTIVRALEKRRKTVEFDEASLNIVEALSKYAYECFPGVFYNDELEKIIFEESEKLFGKNKSRNITFHNKAKDLNILHILTTHYKLGGHSRLMENWLSFDKDNTHSVYIVKPQTRSHKYLHNLCFSAGGELFLAKENNKKTRALELYNYINQKTFDFIFLHTHPEEIEAFLVLQHINIPVAFINHSDHTFWLGKRFADIFVNIREEASVINKHFRKINKNIIVPIPIYHNKLKKSKKEARQMLNISDDATFALCVGSFHKFIPDGHNNINDLLVLLWQRLPDLIVKIIGIHQEDIYKTGIATDGRLEIMQPANNIELYYCAADFIIDPIPKGSYTALLEAAAFENFPLLFKNGIKLFDLSDDPALKGIVTTHDTYESLVENVIRLLEKPEKLQYETKKIANNIELWHSGKYWQNCKNNVLLGKNDESNSDSLNELIDINEINSFLANLSRESGNRSVNKLFYSINMNKLSLTKKNRILLVSEFIKHKIGTSQVKKIRALTKFILN